MQHRSSKSQRKQELNPIMAQTQTMVPFLLLINLFVFIIICCPGSLSHPLHPKHHQKQHFQVLDASASIHKTFQVFRKPTPQAPQQKAQFTTTNLNAKNSSVLSLSLHPRTSIVKPHHQNYSALTLSRLAFDSARVNSIIHKLQLALSERTDPKPLQKDFQSPVTSGESQGTPEYLVRVGVGRPANQYFMVIDTGSDVNWLQCQPCYYCYRQSDPIFDPSGSSTYNPLSCSSSHCNSLTTSGCSGDTCQFYVAYGDGSYVYGDFVTETVTFEGSDSVNNVAIGCAHDNEGLFSGSAGIIGLGGGVLSLPSQIKATSFSYCLVDMDSHSSSTLEFNSAPLSGSIIISIVHNPKFNEYFYVDLTGISVGGEEIPISPSIFKIGGDGSGGVIIDSGTVVTRLVTQAYNSLRDTFVKYARNLPSTTGYSLFDTCYDLSGFPNNNVQVPTVSFHFSWDKTLPLKARNCLVPVDSHGKFCFAFVPSDSLSIIGNIQQQETRVNYDLVNKQIGFSPSKC